jgi:hypothetical protein
VTNILTNNTGGMISGSGTIIGNVNNVGGTVSASDPGTPTTLTINGNYTQGPGGILVAYLGGTTPGTGYSQLVVTGTATLGGTLDLDLVPGSGLVITPNETFDLVTAAGGVSGSFSDVAGLPPLPVGDSWNVSFSNGSMDLTLTLEGSADYDAPAGPSEVPEPSTFLLLAMGVAAIPLLRKYRTTASA